MKEKAKELVNKYLQVYDGRVIQAKQCALIAVDEIICSLTDLCCEFGGNDIIECDIQYWKEVKNEIERL